MIQNKSMKVDSQKALKEDLLKLFIPIKTNIEDMSMKRMKIQKIKIMILRKIFSGKGLVKNFLIEIKPKELDFLLKEN